LTRLDGPLGGDSLMTAAEVAKLFRVNDKIPTRWAKEGRIPLAADGHPGAFRLFEGHWRFRRSVVERMFDWTDRITED
jgi:predicted site-specific integrase-resolvase